MKILFSWLRELVELSLHPEALASRLTQAGIEVTDLTRVDGDWLFEMEVTPNRPDLLSHLGVARETAALLGRKFRIPRRLQKELTLPRGDPPPISVTIEDPQGCRRYVGVVIGGIQVKPSPLELTRRLSLLGIRSVNNVVDVTNLCLLELGQPLHAFDLDRLEGQEIRVRRADPKESLVTIDGISRSLNAQWLVIADRKRPVALAGVMGGRDTEIHPGTKRILLESAWFDPVQVRRATRETRLSSESSYRFERGVDVSMVPLAAMRAARLIVRLAGGTPLGGLLDVGQFRLERRRISLRPAQAQQVLGMRVYPSQQRRLLERLGCQVTGTPRGWRVEPPSYRPDLKIPEDLYEELARLLGYERCPLTLPPVARTFVTSRWQPVEDPWAQREMQIRQLLAAAGMQEILTYSLVNPQDHARVHSILGGILELENWLSLEYSVLRKTLLIGALQVLSRNLHRKTAESFQLFELGRVYRKKPGGRGIFPHEERNLGLLVAGALAPQWGMESKPLELFHLKGIIQFLCDRLRVGPIREGSESLPGGFVNPAVTFRWGEKSFATLARVDPKVLAAYEIPQDIPVAYAELDLELLAQAPPLALKVEAPPKVSPVVRDLAIILPEEIPYESIRQAMQEAGRPLLKDLFLFDLYRGKQIPAGKKSLAFRLSFSAGDKTLTDQEISIAHQRIVSSLASRFQATLR